MATASELTVKADATAKEMAEAVFGSGVEVKTANYIGAKGASGIYDGADNTIPDLAPSNSGVILSTGKAMDFTNSSGDVNKSSGTTTDHGRGGDADLDGIAGTKTYDAAVLEATFVPDGDILTMQLTFASEEYLEYVNSGFNDAVGIFVNGVKAELSVGPGDITINTINDEQSSNLYLDNSHKDDVYNTEMDGLTVVLTLKAPVKSGDINTIKIAIADGGDGAYDSNLLIAADSLQTTLIANDDEFSIASSYEKEVDVLANDAPGVGTELTITSINGVSVKAGDTVVLPSGDKITLTDDGTLKIETTGEEGTDVFSYTIEDDSGVSDTAFVTLNTTAPCFTAGTMISTPRGPIPVEALREGDPVWTRDHGAQIIRWIGVSTRQAVGECAPIEISAGALESGHCRLLVSPQHRMLIRSPKAELIFGANDVLVKAKDLLGKDGIRRVQGGIVHYVHILFDRHEIVTANGLESESYHPGLQTLNSFDASAREEVLRLFPSCDPATGAGFGPVARRSLRNFEAELLLAS
ncbi:MAG: choice-of-anchor L domain-containing protein [Pseudomonadota bacterium]